MDVFGGNDGGGDCGGGGRSGGCGGRTLRARLKFAIIGNIGQHARESLGRF